MQIKTYFPPLIIVGLVGDVVKEGIDFIVKQISPRQEFSIRKTSSSEKQGYVFKLIYLVLFVLQS